MDKEKRMKEAHESRLEIQRLLEKLSDRRSRIQNEGGIREISLTITKLAEARMWLGEYLHAIGAPSDYSTGIQNK